ncbi:MAG: asparagine synthase (glutamine-hydrolyzing) [Bacteroidota bacterium]
MCGIAGYYSPDNLFSNEELPKMAAALEHRGPDACGFFHEKNTGFAHRRLSIIDLSPRANQPMFSASGRYVAVYNGEIYNFREIAGQLQIAVKTGSDTEVIIEAFEKKGPEFIGMCNGMFAIAIYDRHEDLLYLFRDRVGIKPLFYFREGNNIAFGSEIKALMQLSYIRDRRKMSIDAVNEYFYLGYIPQPHTIYENTFKFPAGHYAVIGKTGMEVKCFWNPAEKILPLTVGNFDEAKQELKKRIIESVRMRMISDVPLGTLLSGGIDSSLVTAVAQNESPQKVSTFSIGFKESDYNEAGYAGKVAGFLGTDHHEFIVTEKDALLLVEDMIGTWDEPYADSSALPTMLVSKLARQHVTVTLSGDGGDELFMGYGAHLWAERLANPMIRMARKPLGAGLGLMSNRMKRVSKLFMYPESGRKASHIFSQEQYLFSEKEINNLLLPEYKSRIDINERFDLSRELLPAEQQAFFDFNYYLKDDLLVKVDRASMKYSLEDRVPLLDHNIAEYAFNIHQELKLRGSEQKYILKEILYDYIPAEYFNRPKWGFSIPLKKWLKGDLKNIVKDVLSENRIKEAGIFNPDKVRTVVKEYYGGRDYFYNRVWQLLVFQKWMSGIK